MKSVPATDRPRRERPIRLALLGLWAMLALYLAAHHVVWRDEVRALSFALSGGDVASMLRNIHGEGHPALWYLLLRGGYTLWTHFEILPIVALAVGAATAALFALRAPLGWPWIALALAGRPLLYEYTVMARNYGIGVLAIFGFAALYRRDRGRGWLLGGCLALLANTSVPAVPIACGLWLFWAIDARGDGYSWRAPATGAALLAIGTALCVATVYPPFNDGAQLGAPADGWPTAIGRALLLCGDHFATLMPEPIRGPTRRWLVPLMLAGTLVGWWRRPALLAAAAVGLGGLLALFSFVYEGAYRHQALAIALLLTLAWLAADGRGGRWRRGGSAGGRWPARIGAAAFALLLVLQAEQGAAMLLRAAAGMPESRSAELAALLRRPDLAGAIVIGDPDYNLEVLPYYAGNPTYLVRERRFGRTAIFSGAATRTITPADMIEAGHMLQAHYRRPVVLVMSEGIFRARQPGGHPRGSYGDTRQSAADLARFAADTRPLASFAPLTEGDETYDVFVLNPPATKP